MKSLSLLFEHVPGSRAVSTAEKIATTVQDKLPYPTRQLAKDMAHRYGKPVAHWTASISHAFTRQQSAISHLHKAYVGGVYCVVSADCPSEVGHPGPAAGQRIDQEEEMRRERISWMTVHPTISSAYSSLSQPEQWLENGGNTEPLQSNWRWVEEAAWLWSNSDKRPQDAYERKSGRVFGGHCNQLSGHVAATQLPKEVEV